MGCTFSRSWEQNSRDLGVSVKFVIDIFPIEAEKKKQQLLTKISGKIPNASAKEQEFLTKHSTADIDVYDMNFFDLAQIVAYGDVAYGKGITCPRDHKPNCSIVDAMANADGVRKSKRATLFLSWVWSYTLKAVVSALKNHYRNHPNLDSHFLWWCFFQNNQFRILDSQEKQSFEALSDVFGSQLKSVGRMCCILTKVEHPIYCRRLWCLFEIYTAARSNIPVEVMLPEQALDEVDTLLREGGSKRLTGAFKIEAQHAIASFPEYEKSIKALIENMPGSYSTVNKTVRQALQKSVQDHINFVFDEAAAQEEAEERTREAAQHRALEGANLKARDDAKTRAAALLRVGAQEWVECGKTMEICMFDGEKAVKVKIEDKDRKYQNEIEYFKEFVQNEIEYLKECAEHPNIIKLLSTCMQDGTPYTIYELVEPVGFDVTRLVGEYGRLQAAVPSTLTAHLFLQLASGLRHMHGKGSIHRDLKTENVLVTMSNHAKLIDLSLARRSGTTHQVRAPYVSPEMCEGRRQDSAVDCWGLGIVIHQIYQMKSNLVDSEARVVTFRQGMPASLFPMDSGIEDAMHHLLQLDAQERWTLDQLENSNWVREAFPSCTGADQDDSAVTVGCSVSRKYLDKFGGSVAIASYAVTMPSYRGMNLQQLDLLDLGAMVVLIQGENGREVKIPSGQTTIQEGDWVYFLMEANNETTFEKKIHEKYGWQSLDIPAKSECGDLIKVWLEFDCFCFPEHIGKEATLRSISTRNKFGLNIIGLVRKGCGAVDEEPSIELFPGADRKVSPGEVGLLLRLPSPDGSSRTTMTDGDMKPFMVSTLFFQRVQNMVD